MERKKLIILLMTLEVFTFISAQSISVSNTATVDYPVSPCTPPPGGCLGEGNYFDDTTCKCALDGWNIGGVVYCDPPSTPPPYKIWAAAPTCKFVCDPNLEACFDESPRDPDTCECPPCVEPEDCKLRGTWDQDSCQCIEIVCDPGPGCGNWIGYPTCRCTECIDEPCPFKELRSLDNFCECQQRFDCAPNAEWDAACPPGWIIDYERCVCARCTAELAAARPCPDGSPRDAETCECPPCVEPEDCKLRGTWDQDSCQCIEIVCDPGPRCGNWIGYPECKCTACIDVPCPFKELRSLDNFCECQTRFDCSPNPEWDAACPSGWIIDYDRCVCARCTAELAAARPCPDGSPRDPVTCQCELVPVCSIAYGCADALPNPPCTCLRCIDEPCPDGSSRSLEFDCQCPLIACLPVQGCATWLRNCECTSCTDDLCRDGSARLLENGCQCPPEVACDPSPDSCGNWLPYPECRFDGCCEDLCWDRSSRLIENNCQCPPEYACDPAWPFPPNKIWLGAPDCKFVCDPNLPACPDGKPRDQDCNCSPQVCVPQKCPGRKVWDEKLCKCRFGRQRCYSISGI